MYNHVNHCPSSQGCATECPVYFLYYVFVCLCCGFTICYVWVAGLPFYIYKCTYIHIYTVHVASWLAYTGFFRGVEDMVPEVSEPLSPTGQLCPESPPEEAWRAAGLRYGGPWPAGSPGGRQGEVVCTQQGRGHVTCKHVYTMYMYSNTCRCTMSCCVKPYTHVYMHAS